MVRKILFQQWEEWYCYTLALHAETICSGYVLSWSDEHQAWPKLGDYNISIISAGVAFSRRTVFLSDVSKPTLS